MSTRIRRLLTSHLIASYAAHAFSIAIALMRTGANGNLLVALIAFLLAPIAFPVAMVAALIWPQHTNDEGIWWLPVYLLFFAAVDVRRRRRLRRSHAPPGGPAVAG